MPFILIGNLYFYRSRKQAKIRATELLRLGNKFEARKQFNRCVDVSHKMALELMHECRQLEVDCIVAPYEADAQLAFLNVSGMADYVITEDSDLILFGCKKVKSTSPSKPSVMIMTFRFVLSDFIQT